MMVQRWLGCVVAVGVLLSGASVYAYPQYVAKGYATCGSCHYSPDGGGFANAYGMATSQAMFPDAVPASLIEGLREWSQKSGATGYDDEDLPALQWDAGVDSRFLFVEAVTEIGEEAGFHFIPMLLEAQGVVALGSFALLGTVSPRRTSTTTSPDETYLYSRTHWLQYRFSEEFSLRAGRMVLPFGLRTPDHTVSTRRALDFDKYAQPYGVQLDWNSERWSLAAMGFLGGAPWRNENMQEQGLSSTLAYVFPGRAALGVSALYGKTGFYHRLVGGAFARVQGWAGTYALLESDLERRVTRGGSKEQLDLVSYARLGWFPWEWLDLFGELRTLRMLSHDGASEEPPGETVMVAGGHWMILPGLELGPAVQVDLEDANLNATFMGQLHVFY
jgi:hypothetical protein